jgi:hypothetical protein
MKRLSFAGLAAALLLGGCGDYGRVTQTQIDSAHDPNELGFAGGQDGTITTIVHGNPTDAGRDVFVRQLLAAMNRVQLGRGVKFGLDAGPGGRPEYRVVLLFNPDNQVLDAELCAGQIPPSRTLTPEVTVRAAYCRGGRALTGAIGTMRGDRFRERDRFERFIYDLVITLFPSQRPN